ncbi:MAG: glycosyltransferase [Endomicrobium sp.]|jgi:glycosyltransferase involved in cell wall biosynthesis|nr:glycosyltransferase [Endomicrobium sp.]
MPKVSVIVPIYNVEKYLPRCLDSLLNQTLKDIEIICVEDCSTDNSRSVLKEYGQRDSRLKILYNKFNSGLATTRNNGLKVAESGYIMFCDSDDYYDQSMCLKLYNTINNCNCEIAVCGINVIYEDKSGLPYKESDKKYYAIKYDGLIKVTNKIVLNTDVSVCNKIFKREIIEENNITFPDGLLFEDACFYFCYMIFCKNIFFIKDKFYNYVRQENGIMSELIEKKSIRAIEHLYIAEKIYDFLVIKNIFKNNKELFFEIFKSFFWFAFNHSQQRERIYVINECESFLKKNELTFIKQEMKYIVKEIYSKQNKFYPIKRFFINLLCGLIPHKTKRKNLRKKLLERI